MATQFLSPPLTAPWHARLIPRRCFHVSRCMVDGNRIETEESKQNWDVSGSCVTTVFRKPIIQKTPDSTTSERLEIIFASEGNVCRSVIAEAMFRKLIEREGLCDSVECTSKATKDYNVGEAPEPKAVQVANEQGLQLPAQATSELLDFAKDIVEADLIIVMDKFSASDVMKQVVLHELVDKRTVYSHKVRRLGDFCQTREVEDIDDPLYGNTGGPEEIENLRQALEDIRDSCEGLMRYLLHIKATLQEGESLGAGVSRSVSRLGTVSWLVPPMLQGSS